MTIDFQDIEVCVFESSEKQDPRNTVSMLGMGAALAGHSHFKAHVLLRLLLDDELEINQKRM